MAPPRITVGLPVYRGADLVPKALECLQRQTFDNFEAVISVDGNDQETADACRSFLTDPRFRMVMHRERLDWVGNFNWLLQQDLKDFFCYRQHDDTTVPEFFEVLLRVADKELNAAAIYSDCQMIGGRNDVEFFPSIKGETLDRMFQFVTRLPNLGPPVPIRGLMRRAAIRQAGLVRSDEFRAAWQVFGWLADLLRWGDFRRVPESLYYRLDHPRSYTRKHFFDGGAQAAWTTLFTGVLAAAMRVCRTPEERLFFQQTVLDRMIAYPLFRKNNDGVFSEHLVGECLERLRYEGNTHLLNVKEFPSILHELQNRVHEITSSDRSRFGRVISQSRQRYRFAQVAYRRSPIRRITYHLRHVAELLTKLARRLFS